MKYIVISSFKDLTDNSFEYKVGDFFPREGRAINEITEERLKQLLTPNNQKGRILIKEIKAEEPETEEPEAEEPETEETETKESKNTKTKK